MAKDIEITAYADCGNGRNRSFKVRGVTVLITPAGADDDETAAEIARQLAASAGGIERRYLTLEKRIAQQTARAEAAEEEMVTLRALVPPKSPPRLTGPGCVRFNGTEMWLLNKRETGWSSWGVMVADWDDLFRRYNVRVTGHGTDEHGPWFEVSNIPAAP